MSKTEKVFAVADQKYVGMTVAYPVSDGDDGYYAAKVAEPNETFAAEEWFTKEELFQAFVAGTLVAATEHGFERIVSVSGDDYAGSEAEFTYNPGTGDSNPK